MRVHRWRAWAWGVLGIVLLAVAWEAYKALGPADGVRIGDTIVLPRTNDLAMPHLWTMAQRAGEPVTSAPGAVPLWSYVLSAAWLSFKVALIGWAIALVVGMLLALLMQRSKIANSALLPWVVLSQTVPLIALAPLVKRWSSAFHIGGFAWQDWMSVAVIAAYLAFFPITVGMVRGLNSPVAAQTDLMRSYATGWWQSLIRLRLPASVPYLIPALRLSIAAAVIGTVVAEVSIGMDGGIGRMIIEFAQTGSADPAKQWSPIGGAVLMGLAGAGLVALIGVLLKRYRRAEA
ncbi:ABC transporter permease [Branchiibius sp. NY16-3462-2]|nr:ABC transporter permease [Branchiibius sp. NY16-3462-2]